jgi:hypothetical protein
MRMTTLDQVSDVHGLTFSTSRDASIVLSIEKVHRDVAQSVCDSLAELGYAARPIAYDEVGDFVRVGGERLT